MGRFVYLVFRLFVILIGYGFASLVASAMLHVLVLPVVGLTPEETRAAVASSFLFSVPFIALFVAYFAFFPSVAAIVVGEIMGATSWLFYALSGGVAAFIITGFIWTHADETNQAVGDPRFAAVMLAAGLIGGIAYWLVAGRSAGGWRLPARA